MRWMTRWTYLKIMWNILYILVCISLTFGTGKGEECSTRGKTKQMRCRNGNCIPLEWKCDGERDCGPHDNTDEANCKLAGDNCALIPGRYFRCERSGSCIPKQWRCDGDSDCGPGDKTDENNCSELLGECSKSSFKCDNHKCIPSKWQCDGHHDCLDHSDENDCFVEDLCSYKEFECNSGECIPSNWTCDTFNDCSDGSDESEPIC